ncbi:hypothetical protein AVDCRST_MAG92-4591 [uncultured Coleofasciculus sp.]|uniref:Uncharacterized protein n=1 Tax=uncultured Coleofasciculus sp. TaxID=1267456 RepID=A0A6J4K3W8_9CYAN|nr:hypothetical protein AVDCRST_MAG92-4591 [uncultured Coleofasciculus sp.]
MAVFVVRKKSGNQLCWCRRQSLHIQRLLSSEMANVFGE